MVIAAMASLTQSVYAAPAPQFQVEGDIRKAVADEKSSYVAVFGGATFFQDADTVGYEDEIGFLGGAKVGYEFGTHAVDSFLGKPINVITAVELEGFYLTNEPEVLGFDADMEHLVFSVNGLLKFDFGNFFRPYVGVGVGGAYVEIETPGSDDDDLTLALQGITGAEFIFGQGWSLFLEHKLLYLNNIEFRNDQSLDYYYQSLVNAGLKYKF